MTIYENLKLVSYTSAENYLTMNNVVGRYEQGLIGFCEDPDLLRKHKTHHAALDGVDFKETDNPVILFFRLENQPVPLHEQALNTKEGKT